MLLSLREFHIFWKNTLADQRRWSERRRREDEDGEDEEEDEVEEDEEEEEEAAHVHMHVPKASETLRK